MSTSGVKLQGCLVVAVVFVLMVVCGHVVKNKGSGRPRIDLINKLSNIQADLRLAKKLAMSTCNMGRPHQVGDAVGSWWVLDMVQATTLAKKNWPFL